jgi:hypothetical protein
MECEKKKGANKYVLTFGGVLLHKHKLFFLATSRLCSRGACPSLPRILPLVNGFIFGSMGFIPKEHDAAEVHKEQQARELSPLELNSKFMSEGRTCHCHCMWQWQELLRTKRPVLIFLV